VWVVERAEVDGTMVHLVELGVIRASFRSGKMLFIDRVINFWLVARRDLADTLSGSDPTEA
jgi:hypothetical protein